MYSNGGRSFRFTRGHGGRLTEKQRVFYERNGYLVLPNLVPLDILSGCSGRFDDIVSGKVPGGSMIVMHDVVDRGSVSKVQDISYDDVFREYVECKQLLDVVEAFVGPSIIAMHSMFIAKPPDVGSDTSKHPSHQDMYYFPFEPADRIVAAWTAVEPCSTLNGCLYVAPGSHLPGRLYPHGYPATSGPSNKFYHEIQELPDSMTWVNLEVQPGDTVFFHPLLVHGSGVNRSRGTRRAMACHYAAADCNWVEVQGTVKEPIRAEIMELVRKRFPDSATDYSDVWRAKCKLVRGVRSSL